MKKRVAILLLVMAASSACGSDSVSSSLDVSLKEFSFTPDRYRIAAETETPLTLTNVGTVEHEFVIMKTKIETEADFAEDKVLWEEETEPGDTKTTNIPELAPGTYQIICGIKGHFNGGMKAELVVG